MSTRWLAALLFLSLFAAGACKKTPPAHEHAEDHPEGHNHHAEGHGHAEGARRITLWSKDFELFAEHGVATVGKKVDLLVHLTVLEGFRALTSGKVTLELNGEAVAQSAAAVRPGIYELTFVPKKTGTLRGKILIEGKDAGTVEGVEIPVHESEAKAKAAAPSEDDEGLIELLKEQQWKVPFATAFAGSSKIVESIEVAGRVDTPPGGSAEVSAPIAGRVVAPASGLVRPGDAVRKGQVLATFAPAPASPEEAARAGLAVSEAEARSGRAQKALERAERLIKDQAISQRELEDARREAGVAQEAVRAAKGAKRLFSGAATGSGGGSWRLKAPIAGNVVEVAATPGASVAQGTLLFRVVDTKELWLRARVPEQDATRLRTDRDAAFRIAGLEEFLPVRVSGEGSNASVVNVGRVVDEKTRTVDVIYSLASPDPRLRVGGLLRVSLPTGEDFEGVVVPRSAIVDVDGRSHVFVQKDGEHFEQRPVRVGPRQGGLVGVSQGLAGGERVVTTGTHVVKLAANAGSGAPHGHVH